MLWSGVERCAGGCLQPLPAACNTIMPDALLRSQPHRRCHSPTSGGLGCLRCLGCRSAATVPAHPWRMRGKEEGGRRCGAALQPQMQSSAITSKPGARGQQHTCRCPCRLHAGCRAGRIRHSAPLHAHDGAAGPPVHARMHACRHCEEWCIPLEAQSRSQCTSGCAQWWHSGANLLSLIPPVDKSYMLLHAVLAWPHGCAPSPPLPPHLC